MVPPCAWNTVSPLARNCCVAPEVNVAAPVTLRLPVATNCCGPALESTRRAPVPSRKKSPDVKRFRLSAAIELTPVPTTRKLPLVTDMPRVASGVAEDTVVMSSAAPLRAKPKA